MQIVTCIGVEVEVSGSEADRVALEELADGGVVVPCAVVDQPEFSELER